MRVYLVALLLALAFFFIGIFTLKDYGINWDAPYRMIRGSLYSHFYLHDWSEENNAVSPILINPGEYASRYDFLDGEEGTLVAKNRSYKPIARDRSFYDYSTPNRSDFMEFFTYGHPPMIDVLSAFTNKIFHEILALLPDIEGYQIVYIFFSAVGIGIVAVFTYEITGQYLAAAVAALVLGMYPLFFSESHFNMKDPLQASLFAGAIWSIWHWVKDNKKIWAILLGMFIILALNIKWNILFLPFIILPWLVIIRKTNEFKRWFNLKKIITFTTVLFAFFFLALMFFSPASWSDSVGFFGKLITYYWSTGTQMKPLQPAGFILPLGFNAYPTLLFLFQTPEVILLLLLISIVFYIKKKNQIQLRTGILLLLWVIVPLVRVSIPHVWFYNGLRQVMEIIPAVAILSGVGASVLFRGKKIAYILTGCVLVFLFIPLWQYHPNENMYFNHFIGGLHGAVKRNFVDKKISYGNIYKQAANWLNAHAEKNARVALLDGPMFALSPLFLRDDLVISPFYFSDFDQKGEYIVALYDPQNPAIFAQRYPKNFLKPVDQIMVDRVPMAIIYKNDPESQLPEISRQGSLTQFKRKTLFQGASPVLELDLGREVKVTKISLQHVSKFCLPYYGQYVDEFIDFVPANDTEKQPDFTHMYGLQERKNAGRGRVDVLFAGEKAKYIRIYPQSNTSCFIGSRISSITYIK